MNKSPSGYQVDNREILIHKMAEKPGLRGKLDAKCIECIYDPYQPGTWRFQVEECTSPDCPLYLVRAKSTYTQK